LADRPNAIAGTPFTPGEINPQSETNKAAYVMLRFGSEFDSGARLSGNIGLRYTTTDRVSSGYQEFLLPSSIPTDETCRDSINSALGGGGGSVNAYCALTPQERANYAAF